MAFAQPTLPPSPGRSLIGAMPATSAPRPTRALRAARRNCAAWTGLVSEAEASGPPAAAREAPAALERVVCKFGGSSLADADRMREVAKLFRLQLERTRRAPIVVLSAMGPSTNELLAAFERALKEGVVDMRSIRSRAFDACEALGLNSEALCEPLLINLDQLLLGIKFMYRDL